MGKLSKEAWALAFYEVMGEPMPPSAAHMKTVQGKLKADEATAQQQVKAARKKEEMANLQRADAGARADDRYAASRRSEMDRQDYEFWRTEAGNATERAETAYILRKQTEGRLAQVKRQAEDVGARLASGDFGGLDPEVSGAVQQAQLGERLKLQDSMLDDARQKLDQNEIEQRQASGGLIELARERVAEAKERINRLQAERATIETLMQGFDTKPADPSRTKELEDALARVQKGLPAAKQKVEQNKAAVSDKEAVVPGKQAAVVEAAAQDPALKPLADALNDARAAQEAAEQAMAEGRDSLAATQEYYADARTRLDAYTSGKGDVDADAAGAGLQVLQMATTKLADARARLRENEKTLRAAVGTTEKALRALMEAVTARARAEPDQALAGALKALEAAEAEVRRTKAGLAQATKEADTVQLVVDDAQRSLNVAKAMPAAQGAATELKASLQGVEDTPIWDGVDALRKKLGSDKRLEKLQASATALIKQYDELVRNGATIEELRAVYQDIPEAWRPPQFREQEQNWISVGGLMTEEAEDKHKKEAATRLSAIDKKLEAYKAGAEKVGGIAKKVVSAIDLAGTGGKYVEVLKQVSEKLESSKELGELTEKAFDLAAKVVGTLQAPLKAADAAQESMETEDPVEAMLLQDEFMDALGKLMDGLTGSIQGLDKLAIGGAVVKGIADLLPGIGVATSGAAAMKLMVDSAARIQEAIEDANAHDDAKASGHRAETAIDQFARRDKHLAARAVTSTSVAMVKTAAAAVDLTGVGVAASTAMKGVATGVSAVQSGAGFVIDRAEGEKAEALLQRAQAGDGNARAELFRFHPRYAKGLLAVMASEGDTMALRVLSTHGLSDDMVKRSSPKIIKRYLMKKFGEVDEPPSWSSLQRELQTRLASLSDKLDAINGFFEKLAIKLIARTDGDPMVAAQAQLDEVALDLPKNEVATAVTELVQMRMRRDMLAEQADDAQSKDVEAADTALADDEKKLTKLRTTVSGNLDKVRETLTLIGQADGNPLKPKAETAARTVIQQHLQVIEQLAMAA